MNQAEKVAETINPASSIPAKGPWNRPSSWLQGCLKQEKREEDLTSTTNEAEKERIRDGNLVRSGFASKVPIPAIDSDGFVLDDPSSFTLKL
jgi:hypothetical protein